MGRPDDRSFGSRPASAGMTLVTARPSPAVTGAPATVCSGRPGRQRDASASWGPARKGGCGPRTLRQRNGRPRSSEQVEQSGGERPGVERVVGRSDSLRRVGALEVPASAAYRTGVSTASAGGACRRDERVRARGRGKPKGASGPTDAAMRSAGNGLSAGQPLRWRRLLESVQVSAGAREGRRVNHERGWTTGERASDGAVTVATSPGGKRSEGSVPVGTVGRRHRKVSASGPQPGKPHGRQRDATSPRGSLRNKPSQS